MVRDEVLRILERGRGQCVSGEAIAVSLKVSRAAVWKAIQKLRESGVGIDAVPGGGYCLPTDDDALTTEAVRAALSAQKLGSKLLILHETDSTNTFIKRECPTAEHGFTVIAEKQTAGRGRLGRTFCSPTGDGLYMSILLRPSIPLSQLNLLTLAAAVAVCRAIADVSDFVPQIKWVNDILMDGKKLCGILTEASIEGETGAVDFAVLGIGINLRLNAETFPPDLQPIVSSIADFSSQIPRRAVLAAAVLNHLDPLYSLVETGMSAELLAAYREYLCVIGQEVCVFAPSGSYQAIVEELDDSGHLIVRLTDGMQKTLTAGEISIRL